MEKLFQQLFNRELIENEDSLKNFLWEQDEHMPELKKGQVLYNFASDRFPLDKNNALKTKEFLIEELGRNVTFSLLLRLYKERDIMKDKIYDNLFRLLPGEKTYTPFQKKLMRLRVYAPNNKVTCPEDFLSAYAYKEDEFQENGFRLYEASSPDSMTDFMKLGFFKQTDVFHYNPNQKFLVVKDLDPNFSYMEGILPFDISSSYRPNISVGGRYLGHFVGKERPENMEISIKNMSYLLSEFRIVQAQDRDYPTDYFLKKEPFQILFQLVNHHALKEDLNANYNIFPSHLNPILEKQQQYALSAYSRDFY